MKNHSSLWIALCVSLAVTAAALGRGGGGCFEEGTPIRTPSGDVPIQTLRPGDAVLTLVDGQLRTARVQALSRVEPEEIFELTVAGRKLAATSEHPFEIGRGIFRIASRLHAGDTVLLCEGREPQPATVETILRRETSHPAYNLLVSPGGIFIANGAVVHNKGCFLPETPVLRADGTEIPIRDVRPGDQLLAFATDERIVHATVQHILTRLVDDYAIVTTDRTALRVTLEHPFYAGCGTFKTLESLKVGDLIFVHEGDKLSPQPIVSMERVHAQTVVYNLQTDFPNTFFASGIAVHNKGGGGCFPAGTRVRMPQGDVAIERLAPGDPILAVDENGGLVPTKIEATQATRSRLLILETDLGVLQTTAEHPVRSASGVFLLAGDLPVGGTILAWQDGQWQAATIRKKSFSGEEVPVYNLRVGPPHTFIADGFVVHNKGGGGGFGGGRHYGGGASFGGEEVVSWIIVAAFVLVIVFAHSTQDSSGSDEDKTDEDLDFVYSRSAVDRKAAKTLKLLEFIAKVDASFIPQALVEEARSTFLLLQKCWQARAYAPMKDHMMPDLFADHLSQIAGMIRNHEMNKIDHLNVEAIDIVNVRYMQKEDDREFTALFTASAQDYYVDDRTQERLRGDEAPARFQEFWTFHRQDKKWLLREIEQSRESDALKDENFFEQFTDTGRDQVYGDTAGKEGPTGPWMESETETKATRAERLLNFLFQTDKLWDRQAMLALARQVFTHIKMAWESGNAAAVPPGELFPDALENLKQGIDGQRADGITVEYRNFCVRKVELILIRNFTDNTKDDFTVRISAHAQKIAKKNGEVLSQDEYVSPFEEYWTFGRLDNQWKLKEVLPPAKGKGMIGQENIDEESNPEQLEWYYGQTRAV